MDIAEDNSKTESRSAAIGPGERLQAARIQKGLSLQDVANRMHLSTAILEAIEENDFEEITAPIFVKGYLRAYARIVSLDEDEMIQQYSDFYSEDDPPISSTSNMAPELSVADARIKWTTFLVILVLAALLGAWWWNKEQNTETPISLDSQGVNGEAIAQDQDDRVKSEVEVVSQSGTTPTESDAPTADDDLVESTESTLVEAESPPVSPESAGSSADAEQSPELAEAEVQAEPEAVEPAAASAQDEAAPIDNAGNEAAVVAAAPSGAVRQYTAPQGSDSLRLIINADTWADIKDGNDHQLVYDLLRADQSIELTGQAPFVLFLGNGHGVEVVHNGVEVDFASRIRDDNTARINIGE